MSGEESSEGKRGAGRDSLMLIAELYSTDEQLLGQARVRNLSSSGMMADCEFPLETGDRLRAVLRGVGDVACEVMWVEDRRAGFRFDHPIDPKLARKPVGPAPPPPPPPKRLFKL